jgi:hypothetical protein
VSTRSRDASSDAKVTCLFSSLHLALAKIN